MTQPPRLDPEAAKRQLAARARELGFDRIGVALIDIPDDEQHLLRWLDAGLHGEMDYMRRHGVMRSRPQELVPGTIRVVSARMDYWPHEARDADAVLGDAESGYISRYALGRDYHKVLRGSLARLAKELAQDIGAFGYRVCVDSAPVLEKALARNAGLGWIGKHTNLISRDAGSWFFLGEILTDLPLPADEPASAHCGTCTACIAACPTQAIVGPHRLDARRCISYLTIEHKGHIDAALRPLIGNRIYGCDDCLAVCPWNRFAVAGSEAALAARPALTAPRLEQLAGLDDAAFRAMFAKSPVKRIGRDRFLRNVLIAIGNSGEAGLAPVVRARLADPSPLVRAMAVWALARIADPAAWQDAVTSCRDGEDDAAVRAEWRAAAERCSAMAGADHRPDARPDEAPAEVGTRPLAPGERIAARLS